MATDFQFGLVIRGQYAMGDDVAARFQDTLAMVRRAEALGFSSLTKTSHYSTPPFQMLQQIPLLARFTAEVPKMRLNAGIVILPLHSPLAVAEEFATLDVMSGGKMILGVALGYRELEFKAFGADLKQRVRRFEDNLIAIKRLWTEDEVHMKGGHFELDGASCLPKPVQKPHPPIWIGANADKAIERAARLGDCWYINPHQTVETIERQMDTYRRALDAENKAFPAELPMRREVFVAASREEALRRSEPFLGPKYAAYAAWGQEKDMAEGDNDLSGAFADLAADRFLIGTPDEVAGQIVEINRRLGVNHLVMSMEWAGMDESLALDTMELFAAEVMPRVRAGL